MTEPSPATPTGSHDTDLATRTERAWDPVEGLHNFSLTLGPHRYVFSVEQVRPPGSVMPVYLIDCPVLYGRPVLYTTDPDEHLRFLAFTRAALLTCAKLGFAPRIVRCNDWHTAFAPLMLRAQFAQEPAFAGARTVLTLHNIG